MQKTPTCRIHFALALAATLSASTLAFAAPTGGDTKPEPSVAADLGSQTLSGAYLAAKAAQLGGDLRAATAYYEDALRIDPNSQVLQQDAMFAFLADGKFERGVALAAKLRDDPEAGKVARIALGIQDIRDGKWSEATGEFDLVDPSDLDALLLGHLSAWADQGAGRTNEALDRVGELKKASWYPVFNNYQAGLVASLAGRQDSAKRLLAKVVDDRGSAQTSPDAFMGAAEALARIEARAGRKKEALRAIGKGLDLAENYEPLVFLKDQIEKGAPIDPPVSSVREGAAETLYILGQAINRGEGQQVAILYFQLARALDERNPQLLVALAGIAERASRYDEAINYYRDVPQTSALRRTADLQTGLDLWSAERKDEAKAHLEKAVADYPDDLQAYMALADILSSAKNYDEMSRTLDKAVDIAVKAKEESWTLYYQRGIAFERTKQWPKAEADFRKALKLSPNQPQVLNYLGYSWVDMHMNLDEGLSMIKTAVDLRPNDGYIVDSLGWAYYRLARFDDAVEQLERAVLLNPSDPTINDHLGDAYWQVGRTREARFQWQRALVGDPKPEAAEIAKIEAKIKDGMATDNRKAEAPNGVPARAEPAPAETRADTSAPQAPAGAQPPAVQ
ncbi:tetratricopeptide repeat protein [Aureimonas psammosilenae]|uniref:tetratricopeptide repeat protein n=1 Tax=Aureimonas psammosilenae TaxID=2495496 RepID=UPI001F428D32|nr:tetratricopeptide repeat protein [Aureimonas psammosilenae]